MRQERRHRGTAIDELLAQTSKHYIAEIVIAEELETLGELCVSAIEGPQRHTARIKVSLAFHDPQDIVAATITDDVEFPSWRGRTTDPDFLFLRQVDLNGRANP